MDADNQVDLQPEEAETNKEEIVSEFDISFKYVWEEKIVWTHPLHPDIKLVVRMYTMHSDEKSVPEYLEDDVAIFEVVYHNISRFNHKYEKLLAVFHPMPKREIIIDYTVKELVEHLNNPSTCTDCLSKMIYHAGGYICQCEYL